MWMTGLSIDGGRTKTRKSGRSTPFVRMLMLLVFHDGMFCFSVGHTGSRRARVRWLTYRQWFDVAGLVSSPWSENVIVRVPSRHPALNNSLAMLEPAQRTQPTRGIDLPGHPRSTTGAIARSRCPGTHLHNWKRRVLSQSGLRGGDIGSHAVYRAEPMSPRLRQQG